MVGKGSESRRQRRVGDSVRTELSRLISTQAGDPSLAWATVTDVEMSADLKHARVFFVAGAGVDPARTHASLEKAAPFLQRELGRSLKLRFTPRLAFHKDSSFDEGQRIDALIHETADDRANSALSPEDALAEALSTSANILLCVHANPDGDAVGSLLGMAGILRLMGKAPVAYCPDGIPETLRFLPGADTVEGSLEEEGPFELTVLMDTADARLLPDGFPDEETRGTLAVIDHHMTHGDLGDIVIRRPVSAVGELIFQLSKELVWPLNADVAMCLYTSIVADTGSFRYTSTTPETHLAAAALMEAGADPWAAATALYESFPLRRQRLLAAVAGTLAVSEEGRYAELHCDQEMLSSCGATKADLDGLVNMGRSVRGVEISALFREEPGGDVKVSFRSKGHADVAAVAAGFGGGGHKNAAGATIEGVSIEEAKRLIREAIHARSATAEAREDD